MKQGTKAQRKPEKKTKQHDLYQMFSIKENYIISEKRPQNRNKEHRHFPRNVQIPND